jgi:Tol biopolymer transport system component/tRNA A-37 threonylcarbamoyl transferase component Bud32
MSLPPGTRLGGYEILAKLGEGGMGVVYRARDAKLNRQIALKVLPAEMAAHPDRLERFRREAQAVAALNHPNIVTIHSVEDADGVHFLTLELVEGRTLDTLIGPGGLTLPAFFRIAVPLVDAVAAAHGRGVVHRDLKPTNVMVTLDDRVKVLDFGLAKLLDTPSSAASETAIAPDHLTGEGRVLGTVAYMSPEQAEAKPLDHRTDIFSLGVMLYEMATGDRPFTGDTHLSVMSAILRDTPAAVTERNAGLPLHLARIIRKALEKQVTRRYQTALDLRNDLDELRREIELGQIVVSQAGISDPEARPVAGSPAAPRATRSLVVPVAVTAALLLIAAAGVAWSLGAFRARAAAPTIVVSQLTTTADALTPTVSPDGQWIAFVRSENGATNIFLQGLGDQTAVQLTRDLGSVLAPAFAPDGTAIAFNRASGGIWTMGRMGGNVRQVSGRGFNPAWSPDGKKIAFSLELAWGNPYYRGRLRSPLVIVDVATGAETELDVEDAVQPTWSPHGHRLAYWRSAGQAWREIFTVNPDGSDPVRITTDADVDWNPVWSPDGTYLYFASTRGGPMAIWRVPMDERTGRARGSPEQITRGGVAEPGMFSFSADGTRLVYQELFGQARIESASFNAQTLDVGAARQPIVQGSRRLQDLDVSRDGEWLAYRSEDVRHDVFVVRRDGSDQRQLTNDVIKQWTPRFSPDGTRLAIFSNDSGRYQIWVMNRDGSGRVRLTDIADPPKAGAASNAYDPVWSPDGKEIIFQQSGVDVWIIKSDLPYDKQTPRRVPRAPAARPGGPDVVMRPSDWNAETGLIALDGPRILDPATNAIDSFVQGPAATNPRWLDARRLYYARGDRWVVLDTATRTERPITMPAEPNLWELVLSRDARLAYLLIMPIHSDVWMMEMK